MFGCLHNCENWELCTIENECFSPDAFLESIMSTCPTISSRYIPNMSSRPHIELFFEENSKQDLIPAAYFGWICCFSYGILNRISQKCLNFTVTEQMPTCLILGLHLLNFYVLCHSLWCFACQISVVTSKKMFYEMKEIYRHVNWSSFRNLYMSILSSILWLYLNSDVSQDVGNRVMFYNQGIR